MSVGRNYDHYRNCSTDRFAICNVDLGDPKQNVLGGGADSPRGRGILGGQPLWYGFSSKFFEHLLIVGNGFHICFIGVIIRYNFCNYVLIFDIIDF